MTRRSVAAAMTTATVAAVALGSVVSLAHASLRARASAGAHCERRYRDLQIPAYDRRIVIHQYRHVSCTTAARVASATADAYERGLPTVDLPPPPAGVPGGKGHTFTVRTRRYGTYSCRLTARGSDFVEGRCRQGPRFVGFLDLDHYWVHGK
jgi:hypothetical protein